MDLEVSRLARNNTECCRLFELCGMTHTLIGDGDEIYHPEAFNDPIDREIESATSEAELHILRARLEGGIRNNTINRLSR